MINALIHEMNTTSNNLLVSEKVLEIGDLKECSRGHDNDRDDSEGDDSALDEDILLLQSFFVHDQFAKFGSYLLDHVLNLLR